MTKEEVRKSLFNTKVYVDGKSKEIQEKLFELGFKWDDNTNVRKVSFTRKPFLFLNENLCLSHVNDMNFFKEHEYSEVSYDYILNLKWDEDKDTKSEYEEMVKIIEDIRGHYATIVYNKVIVDKANKSIKETESFINEANRLLYQMKKDTTDYDGNKRFFERVKNAYDKYSIKKTTSDLKPFDRVLGRYRDDQEWIPDFFQRHVSTSPYPYQCMSGNYKQCIPYEGNEDKIK